MDASLIVWSNFSCTLFGTIALILLILVNIFSSLIFDLFSCFFRKEQCRTDVDVDKDKDDTRKIDFIDDDLALILSMLHSKNSKIVFVLHTSYLHWIVWMINWWHLSQILNLIQILCFDCIDNGLPRFPDDTHCSIATNNMQA